MQISNLKFQISNGKYASTVFRLGVFVLLAALVVLMYPRYSNAFRYHFEIGKPWGYATLTADFDALSLLPFEEMLRLEAERRPDPNTAAGYGDEVLVFLTSSDRPVVRAQIHRLLGLQRSGILAVPARTSDRRHQEQERNLLVLPVTDWKAPSS